MQHHASGSTSPQHNASCIPHTRASGGTASLQRYTVIAPLTSGGHAQPQHWAHPFLEGYNDGTAARPFVVAARHGYMSHASGNITAPQHDASAAVERKKERRTTHLWRTCMSAARRSCPASTARRPRAGAPACLPSWSHFAGPERDVQLVQAARVDRDVKRVGLEQHAQRRVPLVQRPPRAYSPLSLHAIAAVEGTIVCLVGI